MVSGAWVSGPEDLSPPEYFWGYNRMMTINGLFGAGDTVGGSAHKFSCARTSIYNSKNF